MPADKQRGKEVEADYAGVVVAPSHNEPQGKRAYWRPWLFVAILLLCTELLARRTFDPSELRIQRFGNDPSLGKIRLWSEGMQAANRPAIAMIGDSVVAGGGARPGFDARAQIENAARATLTDAYVWNFAVAGNTSGDVYLSAHRLFALKPRLIVCEINYRWFRPGLGLLAHAELVDPFVEKPFPFTDEKVKEEFPKTVERMLVAGIEEKSYLFGLRRKIARKLAESARGEGAEDMTVVVGGENTPAKTGAEKMTPHDWYFSRWHYGEIGDDNVHLLALKQIAEEAVQNKIPVLFFVSPANRSLPGVEPALNDPQYDRNVAKITQTLNRPGWTQVIDVNAQFPNDAALFHHDEREVARDGFRDDVHLSETGMALLGQMVQQPMAAMLSQQGAAR